MNDYVAPMEGLTDRVWRQAHQKWFGWAGGPARYYAPFLSPPENRVLIKKKMAELAPEANPGVPVIPQLLAKDGELSPVQKAFVEHAALQCGFCTPGFVMAATALLMENPQPTREEIVRAISGNLCRCTGYVRIIEAIEDVAAQYAKQGGAN